MKLKSKIKLFGVFNTCSETNIPLENFIQLDPRKFEIHILSFRQTTTEMENFISRAYGDKHPKVQGLNWKNIYFTLGLLKLITIFLREKPDIIHVHHSFSCLVAGFLVMFFTGAGIISTVHSN